jgi:4-hydroxybenzoate polyprenyltransferase
MFKPVYLFWKNIYLALSAFFLSAATFYLLKGSFPDIGILTATALLTYSAYETATWYPYMVKEGVQLGRHPGKFMILVTVLSLIAGMVLIPPAFIPWIIVFYFMQWNTKGLSGGLRSVFLLKNFLVAGVWTWITTVMIFPGEPYHPWLIITRFVFIMLITMGLDLRDIESDRKLGVNTLATFLGFQKVKTALLLLILSTILVFSFLDFPGKFPFLLSCFFTGIAVLITKPSTGYWQIFLLMDGNLALHALFLLLFRF